MIVLSYEKTRVLEIFGMLPKTLLKALLKTLKHSKTLFFTAADHFTAVFGY